MPRLTVRVWFLLVAGLLEGALVLLALVLGRLVEIDPFAELQWRWSVVGIGVAAAVPMFGLFGLTYRFPVGPLTRIKRTLIDVLGPWLSACRWYDLAVLALVVGFSEELLFRGVLQPWFSQWGTSAGLIGSNVLFGLAHCVTPAYALMAGLLGGYLGGLLEYCRPGGLLAPVLTHALYDFLAFLVVVRSYRREAMTGVTG